MAKIKCVGNKNNSVLYLTDYGNITIATIFVGGKNTTPTLWMALISIQVKLMEKPIILT